MATDFVRLQAHTRPDTPAFWFEGRNISFGALDARSSQCAQALLAAGVAPRAPIAVLSKNIEAFPELWFGTMKARANAVPVNTRLAPPEIAAIVRDSGATHLVFGHEYAELVDAIAGECPALKALMPFERGFDDWIAAYPAIDPHLPEVPNDDIIQLYTSGLPKGVPLTHANCVAQCHAGTQLSYAQWQPACPRCWRCPSSTSPARLSHCCPYCRARAR